MEILERRTGKQKVMSVVETLLLVDGERAHRNALKFLLELNGYRVVEAAHGVEATQLLDRWGRCIHLALVAAVLPDRTGLEWMAHTHVITPDLPVVILAEWDRVEAALTPVGPWYGGLPARAPAPARLLEKVRDALDAHFFARLDALPAA